MDTGNGYFEKFSSRVEAEEARTRYPNAKGIFSVGEQLEIRGSKFRVKEISPFGIKLKLLKAKQ